MTRAEHTQGRQSYALYAHPFTQRVYDLAYHKLSEHKTAPTHGNVLGTPGTHLSSRHVSQHEINSVAQLCKNAHGNGPQGGVRGASMLGSGHGDTAICFLSQY